VTQVFPAVDPALLERPLTSTDLEVAPAANRSVRVLPPPSPPLAVPAPASETGRFPLPGLIARGKLRRRARYLRQLREVQLRDLGGFALELHRFGRDRPELVRRKLESAAETDRELRHLEALLQGEVTLRELRQPGIGGACTTCGAVYGTDARFCSNCGEPLTAER
jgi:hypothetical protein